jgi:thiosulfate reductase cytochrome b subunit
MTLHETDHTDDAGLPAAPAGGDLVRRHRLPVRLWHWANALALFIMLMSGMMIFNAHPHLYWGEFGANPDHPWLTLGTGQLDAFPPWATIPSTYSLADARIWHLAFAWILLIGAPLYLLWSLLGGHLRRDLLPSLREMRPLNIWHDIKQHARLRLPTGAAALQYNVLQKGAYLGVLLVLLPLIILTGLAMSPGADAGLHVSSLFGGRQSARSVHFIVAAGFAAFIVIHLIMVVLAGPFNEIRSMITGWYRLPRDKGVQP